VAVRLMGTETIIHSDWPLFPVPSYKGEGFIGGEHGIIKPAPGP